MCLCPYEGSRCDGKQEYAIVHEIAIRPRRLVYNSALIRFLTVSVGVSGGWEGCNLHPSMMMDVYGKRTEHSYN